ncbi:MAG: GNAT family N-acetyltransferase, partial [Methylococcales bacterium]
VLVPRSREVLETEISCFTVIDRDGLIVGCAALYPFSKEGSAELACIAMHRDYTGQSRGSRLLEHLEKSARRLGLTRIFVLTTQTTHWFLERGFALSDPSSLPLEKQHLYNYRRNSKILIKKI